jgi:hypothetical protein
MAHGLQSPRLQIANVPMETFHNRTERPTYTHNTLFFRNHAKHPSTIAQIFLAEINTSLAQIKARRSENTRKSEHANTRIVRLRNLFFKFRI